MGRNKDKTTYLYAERRFNLRIDAGWWQGAFAKRKIVLCKTCNFRSILGLSGCSNFLPSTAYDGNLSVTANGRQCQAWSAKSPHDHNFDEDSLFPADGSVFVAMNYCRDPNNEGRIWCYTTDPDVIWEYCNFLPCKFLLVPYKHTVAKLNCINTKYSAKLLYLNDWMSANLENPWSVLITKVCRVSKALLNLVTITKTRLF